MEEKLAKDDSKEEDIVYKEELPWNAVEVESSEEEESTEENESSEEEESAEEVELTKENSKQENMAYTEELPWDAVEEESTEEDESSEKVESTEEEELTEDTPSPLQSAVPLATPKGSKQRYKNDDYLNDILVIYKENPVDEPLACFYVTASLIMFRMANSESVKFLRKKFAYLLNYQRLVTAQEPELTMERLATVCTSNEAKEFPEEQILKWESKALHGGAPRMFNYILSFIVNHPIYVLDLSTNQWREYDLSTAYHKQTLFHTDMVQECLPFNSIGPPPFMIAEHLELLSDRLRRTHMTPIMHKRVYEADDNRWHDTYALKFVDYVSFMMLPEVQSVYPFVFASDMVNPAADTERNAE